MCKAEGLGLAPWGVLGSGMFKTQAQLAKFEETGEKGRVGGMGALTHEKNRPIVAVLEKIAEKKKSTVTGIAQAYVMAKVPYVFPIIGIRKVEYLKDSIDALTNVILSDEDIKELEDASPIDLGFPHNMVGADLQSSLIRLMDNYEHVQEPRSIQFNKK